MLARSFDAATQFSGAQNFVKSVNAATWTFYDSVARHIHPWIPSARTAAIVETEDVQGSAGEALKRAPPTILQEQHLPGGTVRVFTDGSIELETSAGTRWFRDFNELERVSKAQEPVADNPSATLPSRGEAQHQDVELA